MTHLNNRPVLVEDHDHDHGDHDHGSSLWSRLSHGVSEQFGAHSHDAADQLDDVLEVDAQGRRALFISLVALALTAIIQAVVVVVSGSVALLGDTLHNVADALTAIPLLVAFRLATRPATKRYTYGFGRAEDLAGLFVIAMIALSSALAAYEAIDRLIHPDRSATWGGGGGGRSRIRRQRAVARYRIRVGRRIGSAALVADGLHARTDGFTSLAVLVGAGGVALGWRRPIRSSAWRSPWPSWGCSARPSDSRARLMDAVDPALVDAGNRCCRQRRWHSIGP